VRPTSRVSLRARGRVISLPARALLPVPPPVSSPRFASRVKNMHAHASSTSPLCLPPSHLRPGLGTYLRARHERTRLGTARRQHWARLSSPVQTYSSHFHRAAFSGKCYGLLDLPSKRGEREGISKFLLRAGVPGESSAPPEKFVISVSSWREQRTNNHRGVAQIRKKITEGSVASRSNKARRCV
jgi:hypothetical protein